MNTESSIYDGVWLEPVGMLAAILFECVMFPLMLAGKISIFGFALTHVVLIFMLIVAFLFIQRELRNPIKTDDLCSITRDIDGLPVTTIVLNSPSEVIEIS